jgi:hypothetical protein
VAGQKPHGQTILLFGLHSPDHPLAHASRRYSGAGKKEKQERRKKQQGGRKKQLALANLLFSFRNGDGARAIHRLASVTEASVRE